MKVAVLGSSSFSGAAYVANAEAWGDVVLELNRPQYDVRTQGQRIIEALNAFKPECVINFVALNMVAESWTRQADYYATNLIALSDLVAGLRGAEFLHRWVQVSTPEVYGSQNRVLAPSFDYQPSTPYAVSRAAMDMALMAYHRAHGFPVIFTRTVNVYGLGQQLYRLIPKTILSILAGKKLELHGGGNSERSFIHIADVANITRCIAAWGSPGAVYHIATKRMTRIRDLVEMICNLMGKRMTDVVEEVGERPGKDHAYLLDDSATRAVFGWTDEIELEIGLASTVEWFTANYDRLKVRSQDYQHKG